MIRLFHVCEWNKIIVSKWLVYQNNLITDNTFIYNTFFYEFSTICIERAL